MMDKHTTLSLVLVFIQVSKVFTHEPTMFTLYTNQATWNDAVRACRSRNSELAIPRDGQIREVLGEYLQRWKDQSLLSGENIWIGMHDPATTIFSPASYTWNDCTLLATNGSQWSPGEPDRLVLQLCVSMSIGSNAWNNHQCPEKHSFVCQTTLDSCYYDKVNMARLQTTNVTTPAADKQTCENTCTMSSDCAAFTFNEGTCGFLLSHQLYTVRGPDIYYSDTSTTGIKRCYMGLVNNTIPSSTSVLEFGPQPCIPQTTNQTVTQSINPSSVSWSSTLDGLYSSSEITLSTVNSAFSVPESYSSSSETSPIPISTFPNLDSVFTTVSSATESNFLIESSSVASEQMSSYLEIVSPVERSSTASTDSLSFIEIDSSPIETYSPTLEDSSLYLEFVSSAIDSSSVDISKYFEIISSTGEASSAISESTCPSLTSSQCPSYTILEPSTCSPSILYVPSLMYTTVFYTVYGTRYFRTVVTETVVDTITTEVVRTTTEHSIQYMTSTITHTQVSSDIHYFCPSSTNILVPMSSRNATNFQELVLPLASLSSTRRQKTSAYDGRPSAIFVGTVAIAFIATIIVIVVLLDAGSGIRKLAKCVRRAKKRRLRQQMKKNMPSTSGTAWT